MPQVDFAGHADTVVRLITEFGLKVIGAVLILVVGRWVAGWLRTAIRRTLELSRLDATLVPFFSNLSYVVLILLLLLSAAAVMGINTTAFIAVLGAAGLGIALAFQGTLSNFAAGVMLLTFRPFKLGDFVEVGGVGGTVREIGIFMTTLWTPDNVEVTVPNSEITTGIIRNFTANQVRRIDLVMSVSYGDDLEVALRTVREVISAERRVLADPPPVIAVHELADSSVNLVVRPWVQTVDYWTTRWDLTKALKEALEHAGCTIPFPQRDVHLHQDGTAAA